MPLHLGEDYTSEPTTVVWDPNIPAEAKDAKDAIWDLRTKGFVVYNNRPGEVRLRPPEKPPGVGILRALTANGDDRIVWDRTKSKEIKDAAKEFDRLKTQGYKAFALTSDGSKGHEIDAFDHNAEEILMVPATRPS